MAACCKGNRAVGQFGESPIFTFACMPAVAQQGLQRALCCAVVAPGSRGVRQGLQRQLPTALKETGPLWDSSSSGKFAPSD